MSTEDYENVETVEATWFLFDEPGMDDMLDKAGGSLQDMFGTLKTQPCVIWTDGKDKEMLFLARYEFPVYRGRFQSSPVDAGIAFFIDFLGGLPYGNAEIMGIVGELSTKASDIDVIEASTGAAAPPIPSRLFEGFGDDKEAFNLLWLVTDTGEFLSCEAMADNLDGTDEPANPHWWYRVSMKKGSINNLHWPVPGEFVALAPRIAPYLPWGSQKSNPFLFSGNWVETVHYTNCKILEVFWLEDVLFPMYKVQYRQYGIYGVGPSIQPVDVDIIARSTDFAEYKVGDRVAVMRNASSKKQSWLWTDSQSFDTSSWVIAPIDFYGKLTE